MTIRKELLNTLAEIIKDYRQGEIPVRTPDIISNWVQQFSGDSQELIIEALIDVFSKTYISKNNFKIFLEGLAKTDKISPGKPPKEYWKHANLLRIQRGGNSQNEILAIFDEILQEIHNYSIDDTGSDDGDFIYLDDCIRTGNRVRSDICSWLEKVTPTNINLHIITPILYQGSYWITDKIKETAKVNGKTVSLHKWRLEDFEMENCLKYRNTSDVLWPSEMPEIPEVMAYVNYLNQKGHPVVLRTAAPNHTSKIFKNESQKKLLEREFLIRGCQIKQECTNLPDCARPLGYHNLDCLGFGSMFVTYRNCPNNCPLALWVQQTDYPPLFPRKTNTQTSVENFLRSI